MKEVFRINQIFIWLTILCLCICFSFPGIVEAGGKTSGHADGSYKFTSIKEEVLDSAQDLGRYKARDAYIAIVKSLEDLKKIHTLVKKSEHIDDVIGEVSDGLDQIASTYEKISNLAPSIIKNRKQELSHLQNSNRETLRTELELKQDIEKLKSENKLLQQRLAGVVDEIDSKNIKVSIQGNLSIINSLEGQRIIWGKFHQAQDKLFGSLKLNGRQLDYLLHVLEVNSRVYHEAANVARLRKSAKLALNNLGSLADIQSVIGDLQESWIEVDDIVSEISSAEFVIGID